MCPCVYSSSTLSEVRYKDSQKPFPSLSPSSRSCSSSSCSAMDESSNKNNNGSGNVKNKNGSGNVKNNNGSGNVKNNNSRGNVKNNNGSGNVKNNNGSGNVKNNNGGNVKNNDYLETGKADKLTWLMKCPPVVSQSLQLPPPPSDQSLHSSSLPIAKITESIDPLRYTDGDDSSTEFTLEFAGTESGNVPKSYSMNMSRDFIPMAAFSESSEGKFSVEGEIVKKFDMKSHQDNFETYAKHWAERTKKSKKKTRQIQVIDDDNGTNKMSLPGETSSIASSPNDKNKSPVKVSETKRTGSDPGEMKDLMFKLFERQPNWTDEQLIKETEKLLRAAIKDLCVHNKKGSNKGSYELKPEYKKSFEESIPE